MKATTWVPWRGGSEKRYIERRLALGDCRDVVTQPNILELPIPLDRSVPVVELSYRYAGSITCLAIVKHIGDGPSSRLRVRILGLSNHPK